MDVDDGKRGNSGVVLSLRKMPSGNIGVFLDDVTNSGDGSAGPWQHEVVVTWKEYEPKELSELALPEEEFAKLGHYVLARLLAHDHAT
jgi:hypothetical protein